MSFSIHSRRCM